VAAFIAEPVSGAGGVIVPPKTYYAKVQAVLRKHDVLFIDDEVICGFGRLGTPFGAQAMDMAPTSMSLAKALTSAYFPLSAVLMREDMYEALLSQSRKIGTFGHGFTYSGHPVGCAVANKTLDIYKRDRIFERVANDLIPEFWRRLDRYRDHPLVGEVRGAGFVAALELVADRKTKRSFLPRQGVGLRFVALAQEAGLLVRAVGGDNIALCPPLVISPADLDELFARLDKAMAAALDWTTREKLQEA
jgi:4-aminobutyrate--pyruvate transaminase